MSSAIIKCIYVPKTPDKVRLLAKEDLLSRPRLRQAVEEAEKAHKAAISKYPEEFLGLILGPSTVRADHDEAKEIASFIGCTLTPEGVSDYKTFAVEDSVYRVMIDFRRCG